MSSLISFFKNRERKKFTSLLFKLPLAFVAFATFSLSAETTPQTNTTECDNGLSSALGYNAFIQYGVTVGGGDTEGPIAMGGDLTLNGTFTVAAHTGGTYFHNGESQAASLVVNGKIIYKSNQGINLNNGFVKIGDLSGSNVYDRDNNNVTTNTRITPGGYDQSPRIHLQRNQAYTSVNSGNIIDFNAAFIQLNAASTTYSQLSNNVTIENGNKITLANTTNVLNLTGNELNNLTNFTFNNKPSANSPLIINVNYAGDFVWNVQNQAGIGDQEGAFIIYNFYNTSKVTINGGGTIMGTLLAPSSHVEKKTSGNINGQVIAKSYNHLSGELHQHTYNHCEAKICALAVDAGNKQVVCENTLVTLTAASTGSACSENVTYTWSGPGIVGNANQESITVDASGTYTVQAQDCDECNAEDTVVVTIHKNPEVSVVANDTSCAAEAGSIVFSFDNYKSRSHIKLSIDGGATFVKVKDNIGSYTFNNLEANTYPISIKWGNNQCPLDLEAVVIEELQSIIVDAGKNQTICSGEVTTLTAQVDEITTNQCTDDIEYLWSTGETTQSITVSPIENTEYTVAINNCGNCTAEDTVLVKINKNPEVTVVANNTSCAAEAGSIIFSFDDYKSRSHIKLSIDGGATFVKVKDNIGSYTFNNLEANTYPISIKWGNNQCPLDLEAIVIEELQSITVEAGENQETCSGEEVTLSAQVEGEGKCDTCIDYAITDTDYCRGDHNFVVYVNDLGTRMWFSNVDLTWTENEDGSATLKGKVFEYNSTSTYFNVDVTYSGRTTQPPVDSPKESFCQSEDFSGWIYYTELTGTVTQIDGTLSYTISRRGPAFQLGTGANVYENENAVYGGSGWFSIEGAPTSFGDFNINLGDCISSEANGFEYLWSTGETTESITVSPTEDTEYSVTVTNCADCVAQDTVTVIVNEIDVDAGDDISIEFGGNGTLTATDIEGYNYVWSTGETSASITVSPLETTTYTVTATNENGCSATDSVIVDVTIDPCLSQEYDVIAYPIPVDVNGILNIDIAIDKDQVVNYSTYRLNGSMIGSSVNVNLPKGCNTINVDLVKHCSFTTNTQYILIVTGEGWSESLNFTTLP